MCICLRELCSCLWVPVETRDIGPSGTVVIGGCELLDMGLRNLTEIPQKADGAFKFSFKNACKIG